MKLPPARILNVTPEEYHQLPGLSSSIAKTIIAKSPAHAKAAYRKKVTPAMEIGDVGHRLVLGKGKAFKELPYDDWRTKDAKRDRDAARAAGLVPIKTEDFANANVMAEKVRVDLAERGIILDGESEFAIEWHEPSEHGPVQCRAMFDHVWLKLGLILDLKFTGDASPSFVERNSENLGYAIQHAAYTRGLTALLPELAGRIDFLFAFCETGDPHAINLSRPDGLFRNLGESRWLRAVATWAECTKTDTWPSYGTGINQLSAPMWALAREEAAA